MAGMGGDPSQLQQQQQQQQQLQQQQQPARVVERLNSAVQQQLNLESVKTRAISLFKAISRILEEFDAIARTNADPKWKDIPAQFSMVNLELFNIVEDIKKVSKAFVVHPKYVNAENAAILPVMLSSKLLPEMETEDNKKRELLLLGMQNLPVPLQIEKLKARIDMIGAACESAEKVIVEARKTHFGTRQGPTLLPTLDKVQAAKIQEQENLLRAAVNHGEGLRISADQRQVTSSLPAHLVDILGDNVRSLTDSTGMYMKGTPPMTSNNITNQGSMAQVSGTPLVGRAAASPGAAVGTPLDNTTASPLQYANSPRSGANMMNTPSPQTQPQTHQLQQQPQLQPQQRQKVMSSLPQNQQQLLAQQQFRQSSLTGIGQNQPTQMHDMQGNSPQKFQLHQQQMQFSQPMGAQQFQGRQLSSGGPIQHGLGQSHLNQGNQLNRQFNQFSNPASNALFNAAQQTTANSHLISNMSAMMPSQSLIPRMQFGMPGGGRSLASQNLSDQMFNMGAGNPSSMMAMQQQQQQHVSQGQFGNLQQNMQQNMPQNMQQNMQQNMPQNMQNLQPGMVPMQNTQQNLSNFQQQRPQNQQQ